MSTPAPLRPDLSGDPWFQFSLEKWLWIKLTDAVRRFQVATLVSAVELARFVDRTIHEGNSTPATFPNFPKSCPPRSDDALLMKLGGVKGLEGIWSFVVLNLEEFLVLLFKSGYLHSLACWLLMCLPGALLTYYCAVAVRNSNLREEIDQHQHEDTLEKLDSMRAILRNMHNAVEKIQEKEDFSESQQKAAITVLSR